MNYDKSYYDKKNKNCLSARHIYAPTVYFGMNEKQENLAAHQAGALGSMILHLQF